MKLMDLPPHRHECHRHRDLGEVDNSEKPYISSVNMDCDYRISPEAGDVSFLFLEQESDNWFVRQINPKTYYTNLVRKRKRKIAV